MEEAKTITAETYGHVIDNTNYIWCPNLPEYNVIEGNSIFKDLFDIDVSDQLKEKNNLTYLSWAVAYEHMMKYDPNAVYIIKRIKADEKGNARYWFDDGKTAWVETEVIIKGMKRSMILPIMDFKNQALAAEKVTTFDANKAVMRCLVKNIALFGLGLWVYQGEDLPQAAKELLELRDEVTKLAKQKFAIGDKVKDKAIEACKKAQRAAFPQLPEEAITGKIEDIEDAEILNDLKLELMALRAPVKKTEKKEGK